MEKTTTFKPTQTQRSVLLAIKFTFSGSHSIDSMRVTAISTLFTDCDTTTVEIFSDRHEASLLRRFWLSLRAGDRVFAADVTAGLLMLRRRSWALHVLPSPDINLQTIYDVEMVDTGKMWATGYVPSPLYTEADSEIEVPFDEVYDEVTVHSREETVHSRD